MAGLGRDGLAGVSGGSTPSLSDGGQESGDVGEGGEGQGSLAAPHTKCESVSSCSVYVNVHAYTAVCIIRVFV